VNFYCGDYGSSPRKTKGTSQTQSSQKKRRRSTGTTPSGVSLSSSVGFSLRPNQPPANVQMLSKIATAISSVGAPSASRLLRRGAAQFSPGRKAWENINAQTRHRSRRLSRDPLQNAPSSRHIAKNAKIEIQARFDRLEYPVTGSTAAHTITYSRINTHAISGTGLNNGSTTCANPSPPHPTAKPSPLPVRSIAARGSSQTASPSPKKPTVTTLVYEVVPRAS